ncbi:MAG: hypothetical protein ABJB11_11385 [Ferruginibacter sp.]
MKVFLLMFCFLSFRVVLFGQAQMSFDYPMVDNWWSFFSNKYDTALIRKNKVETVVDYNQSFYFDSMGRLVKSILPQYEYDSSVRTEFYYYDKRGDLFKSETTSSRYPQPIVSISYKTYFDGRLIKDSSSSGYSCKHFEYYEDGSLRQELWFSLNNSLNVEHQLQRGFWFGVDTLGRINRIIDRVYGGIADTKGKLLSNRTLFYNDKNQLIKEAEAVRWKKSKIKSLFCPNAGSATFLYDEAGRLTEISRTNGPSQKISYLANGLIATIESTGKTCEGKPYHWNKTYAYTYRQ